MLWQRLRRQRLRLRRLHVDLVNVCVGIGVSCCCYRRLSNNNRSILSGKMFFLFRARRIVLVLFLFFNAWLCMVFPSTFSFIFLVAACVSQKTLRFSKIIIISRVDENRILFQWLSLWPHCAYVFVNFHFCFICCCVDTAHTDTHTHTHIYTYV